MYNLLSVTFRGVIVDPRTVFRILITGAGYYWAEEPTPQMLKIFQEAETTFIDWGSSRLRDVAELLSGIPGSYVHYITTDFPIKLEITASQHALEFHYGTNLKVSVFEYRHGVFKVEIDSCEIQSLLTETLLQPTVELLVRLLCQIRCLIETAANDGAETLIIIHGLLVSLLNYQTSISLPKGKL